MSLTPARIRVWCVFFFFSSRRRHTRYWRDWSSDVCSSDLEVVDEKGQPVPPGRGGFLVLKKPWPAMLRGIWRDPERYVKTYWSRYGNLYFTGDGGKLDEDGYFWLLGRVDDIMLIAGHNISTMEVESALVDHPDVAEAAVIGRSDPITGQAITAFVTLKLGRATGSDKAEELKAHV